MTDQDVKKYSLNTIYICGCAINGHTPDLELLDSLNLDDLLYISKKHMLSSMVGQILLKYGYNNSGFNKSISLAQSREIVYDNELKLVKSALENSGIWYMPLKGMVLKDMYPEFAMREMCDVDILFDSKRDLDVKCQMEKLGYETKVFNKFNDDKYLKTPFSSIEMHRVLYDDKHDKKLKDYYSNIKEKLIKDPDNSFGYHFSPEDFYIYLISHTYKHYYLGGTGLRSLIDIYIYIQKNDLNMSYISEEVGKLDISSFEKEIRELSFHLFNNQELNQAENEMLDYIIQSGVYGSLHHAVQNEVNRNKGKRYYLLRRIFGPIRKDDPYRENFKNRYALFFKCPVLLPFLPFYRLVNALKNNPKKINNEIKSLYKAKNSK